MRWGVCECLCVRVSCVDVIWTWIGTCVVCMCVVCIDVRVSCVCVLCVCVTHPLPSCPPPGEPYKLWDLGRGRQWPCHWACPLGLLRPLECRWSPGSRAWSGTLGGGKARHRGQVGAGAQPDRSAGVSSPQGQPIGAGPPSSSRHQGVADIGAPAPPQPSPLPGREQGRGSQSRK